MPKAAMHKNSESSGRVTDIWFAGRLTPVYPITAQSVLPKDAAKQQLRLSITAFVTAHVLAYLLSGSEWGRFHFVFSDFFSGRHLLVDACFMKQTDNPESAE